MVSILDNFCVVSVPHCVAYAPVIFSISCSAVYRREYFQDEQLNTLFDNTIEERMRGSGIVCEFEETSSIAGSGGRPNVDASKLRASGPDKHRAQKDTAGATGPSATQGSGQ